MEKWNKAKNIFTSDLSKFEVEILSCGIYNNSQLTDDSARFFRRRQYVALTKKRTESVTGY